MRVLTKLKVTKWKKVYLPKTTNDLMSAPLQIFIAYARKDAELLEELRIHLRPLERTNRAKIWYDGKIEPGTVWEDAIKKNMDNSDIILLLISADAIASDYFYEKEMTNALVRHKEGKTKVMPLILRPCRWNATPIAQLQVLPKDGKPISTWNNRDEAWDNALESILHHVSEKEEEERAAQLKLEVESITERKLLEAEFKQKEAEYKQLAAETETAVLRLQMNPHFIFNSMNSIRSYILSKDIDSANAYLGRFARLMRTILNHAAKPRIVVADEIEFLEQYIKTEAMRFEQKFEYKIEVDDAIDPDEVLVPTMILQPFVENAIWHGLSSKQGQGKLYIGFKKSGDSLVCSVEDNGKGRGTAVKGKDANHESKALKIIERRLQLLENQTGKKSSFDIIDMYNKEGIPKGTRIEIRIPYLEE